MTIGDLKDLLNEHGMEIDDHEIVVHNLNTQMYYWVDEARLDDLDDELILEFSESAH